MVLISLSDAHAMGPIGEFLSVASGAHPLSGEINYAEARVGQVKTNNEEKTYSAVDRKFGLASGVTESWSVAPEYKVKEITSEAIIPKTNRALPKSLTDAHLKAHYSKKLADSAGIGVYANTGQATDHLLKGMGNNYYNVSPYITMSASPRMGLVLFLNYANNRPWLNEIPLAGLSYGFALSPRWGMSLGFPCSSLWAEPFDWFKVETSAELLYYLDTKVTLSPISAVDLYLGVVQGQEVYKRAGRNNKGEQLIYNDLTYSAGISKKAGPLLVELGAGFGANRYYLETEDFKRDKKAQVLTLQNGWIGQFRGIFKF